MYLNTFKRGEVEGSAMTKQTNYFVNLCLERYRHRFTNKVINKILSYLSSYNQYEWYNTPQYIFTPTQKEYVNEMFDPPLFEWDRDLYLLFTPYSPGHNDRLLYNSIKFESKYPEETDEEDSDSDSNPFGADSKYEEDRKWEGCAVISW